MRTVSPRRLKISAIRNQPRALSSGVSARARPASTSARTSSRRSAGVEKPPAEQEMPLGELGGGPDDLAHLRQRPGLVPPLEQDLAQIEPRLVALGEDLHLGRVSRPGLLEAALLLVEEAEIVMGQGEFRGFGQDRLELGLGPVVLLGPDQRRGQAEARPGDLGLRLERLLEVRQGLDVIGPLEIDLADERIGLGVLFVDREGPFAEGDDVVGLALVEQDIGQADQALDALGVVFEQDVQRGLGLLGAAQLDVAGREQQQGLGNGRLFAGAPLRAASRPRCTFPRG